MLAYLDLLRDVLTHGQIRHDRTGIGTISVFGRQLRFDLQAGFPLLTTKKLHIPSIIHELLWFLSGDTNIAYLKANQVSIWDEWADEQGELGPIYGQQWRAWRGPDGVAVDQLNHVMAQIRSNPQSRRLLVNAWNPAEIEQMALPPCHYAFQFYVEADRLSCLFNMRSVDVFLGLPFNIASYALLTHLMAQQTELQVGELIWSGGDVHVYRNHLQQAECQLARQPRTLPVLELKRRPDRIEDYRFDDIDIVGYDPLPHIAAPVAV